MDGKIQCFWNTNEPLAGGIKGGRHEWLGAAQGEIPNVHVPQTGQAQAPSDL